jgi:hypothetical protein
MLVTAKGGIVRIGKLDGMGRASLTYYENPHPRETGEGHFSIEGDAYHISWRPIANKPRRYRIIATKDDA